MSYLSWLVVGLVAGLVARAVYPGEQGFTILSTIALGIIGAFVGGFVSSAVFGANIALGVFTLPSLFASVIGACLLIFLLGLVSS